MNNRSGNRQAPPPSLRLVGLTKGTSFSKVGPEPSRENRRTFFDDFNLEHSLSIAVTRMTIPSSSSSEEPKAPGRRYTQSQHSPSCVYLG